MSNIIKLNNPFRRTERQVISLKSDQTIYDIRHCPEITKDIGLDVDVDISINGIPIPKEQWLTRKLKQDEFLFILPKVAGGGDGKQILNIVLMVALIHVGGGMVMGTTWGAGTAAGTYSFMGSLAMVGIAVGGAMIISALTPAPKMPSSGFTDDEQSQVFGWAPATIQRQGIPVPRFYGLNKLYGNVVSAYTEREIISFEETTIDELLYYEKHATGFNKFISVLAREIIEFDPRKINLYALFNIGIGPIREPVVNGTLKLNDELSKNLTGVFYETRRGNLDQGVISYFEDTKLEVVVGRLIEYGTSVTYVTKNANFHNLEIELSFPNGLYDGSGADLANNTVNVTVEIKKTTGDTWTKLADDVAITDNVSNKVIETYLTSGVFTVDYGSNYEIRVTKETAERNNIRYGDNLYLDKVREIIEIPFKKPRRALVGVKALATNQLSGSIRFSCYSRGLYVVDFTDSASPIIYSDNPALVIYDILTQPVYSGEHSPWLDLKLLLNFNGVDAAVTTLDESERGHIVSFTATAELDTAEKKFGTAALLLDGDSDDVNIANDNHSFNIFENLIDDWTVDFFVKMANHDGTELFVAFMENDSDNMWYIGHTHDTGLILKNRTGGVDKVVISEIAGEITDNNWHHIAACKVGALIGLYLDETQIGYDLMVAGDADTYDGIFFIGQQGNNLHWFQGHIDHVRIMKQNIFGAAPNDTPNDTITEPAAEYTDPGNSYAVERYDGYNPSKLNDADFEDLADWCDEAQINPENFGIASISQAVHAVVVTTSNHNLKVGDTVLFRGVSTCGMVELTDETTAEILSVTNNTTFTIDLDTSAYTAYTGAEPLLLVHFDGIDSSTTFTDEVGTHTITTVGDTKVSAANKKFGTGSGYFPGTDDALSIPDHANWDVFVNNVDNWTIDFWVKHNIHSNTEAYISQVEDVTNYWGIMHIHGIGIVFELWSGIEKIDGRGGEITDTNWHHIALCKVANEYGLYLDGNQVSYNLDNDTDTFAAKLHIGSVYIIPTYFNEFNGYMDELCIIDNNRFNAAPNVGKTDTITIPTASLTPGVGTVEKYQPRFAFNGGFDTETNMWEAALRVCELCRCVPYWNGDKIHIAIDKSTDSTYAFTMGNILKDSYNEIWIPKAERASEIEIHYRNAQQDYERQPFLLINPNAGERTKKTRLDLFGITDTDMSTRLADFRLLQNQYIRKMAKWASDIEAIPCVIGDVVDVQHDVTNYGLMGSGDDDITGGGRVIAARIDGADNIVTVDGKVEFDDADWESPGLTAYNLLIKSVTDNAPESLSITDCAESAVEGGTYDITVDGLYAQMPVANDVWAAGEATYETQEYRIINLRQNSEQRVEITGIQYVEDVYEED